MKSLKILFLGTALPLIHACSHPIEIVGEGDVTSASGNRNCLLENFQAGDEVCSKNYAIGAYQETYYATPRAGWVFDHWGNGYCTDATPPNYDCAFDIAATIVRNYWGQTMPPLQAVFTPVGGQPITDTVTVAGVQWAQVDLFSGLSWNEIAAACPPQQPPTTSVCSGVLAGYDMTGWALASSEFIRDALFLNYEPNPQWLGIGSYKYWPGIDEINSRLLSDGWRLSVDFPIAPSGESYTGLIGWIVDTAIYNGTIDAGLGHNNVNNWDSMNWFNAAVGTMTDNWRGAWIYRSAE